MRLQFRLNILLLIGIASFSQIGVAAESSRPQNEAFVGLITPESVENFISKHPSGTIQTLVITSEGGDGHAGMRFGNWVRDNGLDVEVAMICKSACATFVFPAGYRKKIRRGSLVLWHGSIEQKNFRELHAKYQNILAKNYRAASSLSDEDRKFLDDNKNLFESLLSFRDLQARYFDAIQVNEYINRLGQEPTSFGSDSWTTTPKVMEKFGIRNVEAPADYGTLEYLRRLGPIGPLFCGGQCLSFDLDEFDKARRLKQ